MLAGKLKTKQCNYKSITFHLHLAVAIILIVLLEDSL